MSGRITRSAPLVVVMVGIWLLLQGELTIGNVLGGVLLAGLLVVIFPVNGDSVSHLLHPWAFIRLIGFVLYSLVLSSWSVIKVIVNPTPTALRSGIVKVTLQVESPLTATIVANAVTLTPGTMTLTARVHPAELHIHVLGLDDADEFRASVDDLERRTVAALEPVFSEPNDGGRG
ncbi:MAG: Na+/H+ antiporter subunit E [Ilumatobacteraceae bacterium]